MVLNTAFAPHIVYIKIENESSVEKQMEVIFSCILSFVIFNDV